ncbi:helix-turn-helix transcriptional regulator [Acidaminobacter sp. JC074]|uniref:helix-turn-helix domain-containing protein n=1 Tax=Acidaminobacter sp. JC074 TaxID=2530199 RepID=UPI001F10A551|nr:helix-turn-helix transcriptional regulator [Acidaminobacter sp. JC074]MCH4890206.1 helix-turn-helix transcriptional regulator [Acidaminobacter sp. JC074]
METIISIDSITQLHEICGYEKPTHPLVTVMDISKINPVQEKTNVRVRQGFYAISMKSNVEAGMEYGRQYYDFQEGSLVFVEPNQIATYNITTKGKEAEGWLLCIHPEFLRGSELAKKMDYYTFFSYDAHEALHVSEVERNTLNNLVKSIQNEITQNIDHFSRDLIINNLELILNYSNRYYSRQFLTRTTKNKDVITEFHNLLKDRFQLAQLEEQGIPSVKELATSLGYSPYYLSDLLKKETGKGTKEYIQEHLLAKSKDLLISSEESVANIGYLLGFEYPANFSKFFKNMTGITPSKYRHVN